MFGILRFSSFGFKIKNMIVVGGLIIFVFGVYFYIMRVVGGIDEFQVVIDKFEEQKYKSEKFELSQAQRLCNQEQVSGINLNNFVIERNFFMKSC